MHLTAVTKATLQQEHCDAFKLLFISSKMPDDAFNAASSELDPSLHLNLDILSFTSPDRRSRRAFFSFRDFFAFADDDD